MSSRINDIHPELLAAIFSFCVTSNLVDMYRITRVCRHWHQVALAFPSLWSSITLNTETIFTTLEEPSDDQNQQTWMSALVPVHMTMVVAPGSSASSPALCPVSAASPCTCVDHAQPRGALGVCRRCLYCPRRPLCGCRAQPPAPHSYSVPPHLPLAAPPQPHVSDDRRLPLARGPPYPYTAHNVLARLPRLKELKLVRCLPISTALYSSNVPRLALPYLTNLALYAGLLDCAHVLDCLSFPPGARTDFECHTSSGGCVTDEFARFLAALHTARADGPLPRPCELRLFPAYTAFGLTVGPRRTTPLELTADPRDPTLFMRLQCVWMLSAGRMVDTLIGVALGLVPLRYVELLYTGNAHLVCRDTWAELLMHLPVVRTLSYVGEAHTLFEALAEGTPGAGVLLLQLQTLSCSHVDLRLRTKDALGILRKFLGTRRDVGYPIRELRLVKCYGLDVGVINALRELVERVEWDQAVR
ncbi:hypothetical protein BD779DRAFT_730006 [Infundibulicybe gibba]|nr:hypothetical protein BD779DRAFT_730006 [Infundibulicybe gibba]